MRLERGFTSHNFKSFPFTSPGGNRKEFFDIALDFHHHNHFA